jgi:zinc/manganese transport system permease protein
VLFAVLACDGGLLASLQSNTIKASVFVTTFSFAIYVLARVAGGALRLGAPRSRPQLWRRHRAS